MRSHSANELITEAQILAADGTTVLASGVACGVTDLSGRALEQAQLTAQATTHLIVMRWGDAVTLTSAGYVLCEEILYIVDGSPIDPRKPRPRTWAEIFCHVERSGNQ